MRREGRGLAGWWLGRAECREVRRGRPCRAHSRRAAGSGLIRPEERPGNGALRERLATVRLPGSCLLAAHIPPSAPRWSPPVRKLDHSDAGGFPGETSARVQLYPQRAPAWAAAPKQAAAACPSPGSPLPGGAPGSLLREARGPREGRFPFRFVSGS